MELKEVLKSLQNYKNGTYIKIQYSTNVPIIAKEYKDYSLVKIVTTIARLGCSYGHVVNGWVPSKNHKNWYHNLYKNIVVQHNNDESKNYIKLYTTNNPYCTKTKYFLNGEETIYPMIKDLIKIKEKDEDEPKMYLKNVADIISIG